MPPLDLETARWFSAEVQPHEAMLRAWIQSQFPSESEIDDIVQDAYVRLLRVRAEGKITSPKALLFATARNLARDRFRHRQVARAEPLVENEALSVLAECDSVLEIVARNQELEMLTEAIQALPDRCRRIFTLRKIYGMSQS